MSLAGKCSSEVPPNLIALLFLLPHSRYCVYFFFSLALENVASNFFAPLTDKNCMSRRLTG